MPGSVEGAGKTCTMDVLMVFTARKGLCQDSTSLVSCKSWRNSQTLQSQFPHLYMGMLTAPNSLGYCEN